MTQAFAERLATGALTTCLCWTLTRRDGLVIGLTDHDRAVTVQGLVHVPGGVLPTGRFETAGGLRPGRAALSGALSADAIHEDDLQAGVWDGAKVTIHRVNWQAPDEGVLIWTGYFSELTNTGSGFEAELISRKADLERPLGRAYSRRCDARFGDERCGLADVQDQTCDKRFETCRDVFANAENFRGFPTMPGQDFILAGPGRTGSDGGQR
jgi:uncharacterized phage protein (TIGR02218 family)